MRKILILLISISAINTHAQTLFTYGKKSVSKQEFLAAFNKNPSSNADRKKALEEYKNLYINFKLKVQSAYDEKLQDEKTFKLESENFKKQIAETVINDEANAKTLLQEAFARSQKDIDVAQIFIATNNEDEVAKVSINNAYSDLKSGKLFEEVLNKYCNDEAIKKANGSIGYITVFSLPYEIENVIYNIKQGAYSLPYKSAYGWHIFKNISERPAAGKRKMAQILLSYPPNASKEEKDGVEIKANEVFKKVIRGENFGMLAQEYSNDYSTANNKGEMGEIGLGKYNRSFEEKIFSLKNNGDYSSLIYTDYGIHMLKLIEIIPIAKTMDDINYVALLKSKLDNSDRLIIAKSNLLEKWKILTGFRKAFYNESATWAFVDSSIEDKSTDDLLALANDSTILFSFKKQNYKLIDFIQYVKNVRFSGTENGNKNYKELIKMFEDASIGEYYRSTIELYNKSIQSQLNEFNDANLLFAAMDKNVWNKASTDTTGLKNYYNLNKDKFKWQPGIAAISISANSKTVASELFDKIKTNPSEWRNYISEEGAKAAADSGRYEFDQLPIKTEIEKKIGFISELEKNGTDDSYSFLYVTKIFNEIEPRSFEDSRGLVMNEYQQQLEQIWVANLKKKYPVKVNEGVWKTIK